MGASSAAKNDESLSKYGYKWRKSEIVENKETSLSPEPNFKAD